MCSNDALLRVSSAFIHLKKKLKKEQKQCTFSICEEACQFDSCNVPLVKEPESKRLSECCCSWQQS